MTLKWTKYSSSVSKSCFSTVTVIRWQCLCSPHAASKTQRGCTAFVVVASCLERDCTAFVVVAGCLERDSRKMEHSGATWNVLLTKLCLDYQITTNEIGHLRERGKMNTWVCWETLMERDHLEDPTVDGRIILKWFLNNWQWKERELVWYGSN
jgi:hypothetical protein